MLRIGKADYDLIRWEAERSYPHESCGIILGKQVGSERTVTMTVPCKSTPPDPRSGHFHIRSEELSAALKLARSRSEGILGFYQSHPDPSSDSAQGGLTDAQWFGCSYIITSVEGGRATTTDSYLLIGSDEQRKFHREEIKVVQNLRIAL